MIKAKISGHGGRDVVLLGIDAENVKRLQEGKPIMIQGQHLLVDLDILIVYGQTLEEIAKEYNLPAVN